MITLDNGEACITSIRRHWIFFASEMVFFACLAVAPFVLYRLFGRELVSAIQGSGMILGNAEGLILFCYSAYLLFLWLGACLVWTDYHLDVWVITDQRIVDVEQNGLFHRKVSEFRMDMIQDVTVVVPGFLALIFGYGNMSVQTASERSKFDFNGVARPEKIRAVIMGLHHKAVEKPREVTISSHV